MDECDPEYPSVIIGPTPRSHGPGTRNFDGLVKSVATAATRVGAASRYGYLFWRDPPPDVRAAREKLEQAQRLLLGAHALLRAASLEADG